MGWYPIPLCWPNEEGKCDCGHNHQKTEIGKAPLVKYKGVKPTDALVREWWTKWPWANIGINLELSGLVDIAPDSPVWLRVFQRRGLPDTPHYASGGGPGHQHHLYRRTNDCPFTRIARSREFDILSSDLTTVPPSIHRLGKTYSWLDQDVRLTAAPLWAVQMLQEQHQRSHTAVHSPNSAHSTGLPPIPLSEAAMERWDGTLVETKDNGDTDHSQSLYYIGLELAQAGVTEDYIAQALEERDETLGWRKYTDRADAQTRYRSIAQRVVAWVRNDVGHLWNATVHRNGTTGPISAAELIDMELPKPRFAVPGLLPEGLAILGGRPKLGKSWLALGLAINIATGEFVMDEFKVRQGEVLYLALEDSQRRIQGRLMQLGAAPKGLFIETIWRRTDNGGLDDLDTWLAQHPKARLVVVDTWAKVSPSRKNKNIYDEDYAAVSAVKQVADKHHVCILIVMHLRKGEMTDPVEAITGSTGITGGTDTILVLARQRGRFDAVLTATGRDINEQELALRFDAGRWVILGKADEYRIGAEKAEILELLRQENSLLRPSDVAAALGRKPGTVRWHMSKMAREGILHSEGTGYTLPLPHKPPTPPTSSSAKSGI
jgi:hypothetical protein